jgi:hypothetical protein
MNDTSNGWRWAAGAVVMAAAIGAAVYLKYKPTPPGAVPATVAPAPAAPVAVAPRIQHPIEALAADPATPLPALEQSDAQVLQALVELLGSDALTALLEPEYLIARIVATVDNLPRRAVAVRMLPTRPVAGAFLALQIGDGTVIAPQNAARYDTHVRVMQAIDARRLVALYARWYPLFQQAYRELGYPEGYFNDRLVEVIDHLLAASAAPEPIAVTRPKVLYEYVDPVLESRSAGERVLLRIGSANAARVQAKLREIRAALVAQPPAPAIEG